MRVGLLTIKLRLHAIETIKTRRSVVKRILADVHRLGPSFAICELPESNELTDAWFRIAHVSGEARFTDSALRRLAERLERSGDYEVERAEVEIV